MCIFVAPNCLEKDKLILFCGLNIGFDKITLALDGKISERISLFIRAVDDGDIRNRPL
jgi:hypothetical protein